MNKVVLPSSTRWLYYIEVLRSFIKLKDHFNLLCSKAQINSIDFETFDIVESLIEILAKYENLHKKFQNRNTLISCVIPSLLDLQIYLEGLNPIHFEISDLVDSLLCDFENRFAEVFQYKSSKFSIYFSLATFLDPSVHKFLKLPKCKGLYDHTILFIKSQSTCSRQIKPVIGNSEYQALNNACTDHGIASTSDDEELNS